jgi:hypothetical protein
MREEIRCVFSLKEEQGPLKAGPLDLQVGRALPEVEGVSVSISVSALLGRRFLHSVPRDRKGDRRILVFQRMTQGGV